ncbi:hypothetical protein Tco_0487599 [Tanacetum coccineum]
MDGLDPSTPMQTVYLPKPKQRPPLDPTLISPLIGECRHHLEEVMVTIGTKRNNGIPLRSKDVVAKGKKRRRRQDLSKPFKEKLKTIPPQEEQRDRWRPE